jgi:hypothetical protein
MMQHCTLVDACTELPRPSTGYAIHKIVVQSGWNAMAEVSNSLISLNTKFSLLDDAVRIFESMDVHTIVSWNSLIDALLCGHIGHYNVLFFVAAAGSPWLQEAPGFHV